MKISELSERISVVYFETEKNARGDILSVVEKIRCEIWAKVLVLNGKNNDTKPEQTNKINYRVTMRYREDLKPDDEILWCGRRLKLLSPPYNLEGKKIYTAFEGEEAVSDGTT